MHYEKKSPFQTVQVITSQQFGKTLVLDGKTQSAQFDEFVYHESLVHPAMCLCPTPPKRVFIGGGGELATAREVLKHTSVEKVVMVDLDKDVVDVSLEMLPEWGKGAMEDPRLEVLYEDALAYLDNHPEEVYDVIIMDIADPIEAGPGYILYTEEFYASLARHFPSDQQGVFVTQSGPGAYHNVRECCAAIYKTLDKVFDVVLPYTVDIASFGSDWAFNLAFLPKSRSENQDESNKEEETNDSTTPSFSTNKITYTTQDPSVTNQIIEERIQGGHDNLYHYDGETHLSLFNLSKAVRNKIEEEDRIITKDSPIYMF